VIKSLFIVILLSVFVSCQNNRPRVEEGNSIQNNRHIEFNADSAYLFVLEQCHFGYRTPESKASQQCAEYLVKKFKNYNAEITEQNFSATLWNGKSAKGKNIIASYNVENANRIMLSAHWDSRATADHDPNPANWNKPIAGANDGASGVAVLLELARLLASNESKIGVDIVLFDLEDQGTPENEKHSSENTWCLGSQYWAKNPHKAFYKPQYGILLDMVGCNNPLFTKEGTSMYYCSGVMNTIWNKAKQMGYGGVFSDEETGSILDDHYYINLMAKIPTIDIIQYDRTTESHFFPHWHTVNDTPENVNKETMQIVGNVLVGLIKW
jgi:Zn-dependent M28 family amino/carboxypeptidase